MRYAIVGIDRNGDLTNVYRDGRTYKYEKTAENIMYKIMNLLEQGNTLKVVPVEVKHPTCPHCKLPISLEMTT